MFDYGIPKAPKINVIIWDQVKPTKAWKCVRSLNRSGRWIHLMLNGERIFYDNSCGILLSELPKKKLPKDAIEISVEEANKLSPTF